MSDDASEPTYVWVYRYTYWEDGKAEKTSKVYATLETIKMGLGLADGASGIRVDRESVKDGIYTPTEKESSSA